MSPFPKRLDSQRDSTSQTTRSIFERTNEEAHPSVFTMYTLDDQIPSSIIPPSSTPTPSIPTCSTTPTSNPGHAAEGDHQKKNMELLNGSSEPDPIMNKSCIVFLQGYLSEDWITKIKSQFGVAGEFFDRHLDFHSASDPPRTLLYPGFPSSSSHMLELPIMTIGMKCDFSSSLDFHTVGKWSKDGIEALDARSQDSMKRSLSPAHAQENMVRKYIVFDDKTFAIEQRISIYFQLLEGLQKHQGSGQGAKNLNGWETCARIPS
ncbi:hypothetical protein PT974_07461 [Cladobotryum mycophilum]|uniref:Uncharacterized protein n=1 Tax=Cladobotryum mycophilum TaxID=491253 RepID=A0ABR0SQH3_9HYPO